MSRIDLRCANTCRYQKRCGSGGEESKICFPALRRSVTTIPTNLTSFEKNFLFVFCGSTVGRTRLHLKKTSGADLRKHRMGLLSSFISEKELTNNPGTRSSFWIKWALSAPARSLFTVLR